MRGGPLEAMILAAGEGTRLHPLTERIPKALVEVAGRPMLWWVLKSLTDAGVSRIIVNTHFHDDQIRAFLRENTPEGVEIAVSHEPEGPLDTGGGLVTAAPLFRSKGPFILHNVDVLSRIPLEELWARHVAERDRWAGRLVASLAVRWGSSDRQLLFDDLGLMGWENRGSDRSPSGARQVRDAVRELRRWSFTGIHVVERRVFRMTGLTGKFSIIAMYLELASRGEVILPVDTSTHDWIDVGTHERLEEANRMAAAWRV